MRATEVAEPGDSDMNNQLPRLGYRWRSAVGDMIVTVTIEHDEILAKLALPWIEIVPSRRTMSKRSLPSHAHEPSPNVIVVAHSADKTTLDVCSKFLQRHWKPRFNMAHAPGECAWQIITPSDERLLIFTWVNWLRNSRPMFEEFCRETSHEFGTLTPDGIIVIEARQIPFRQCRLIHQDQLRRRPATIKKQSAKSILAKADELLRSRKSKFENVDYRELSDDEEAHDDEHQAQLESIFLSNMASYEKALSVRFGTAVEVGPDEHKAIPINGVVRHAIWAVGKKRLYLAVSHEDRELPWVTYLGIIA